MESFLMGLGWLIGGGTLGIVLMCSMFVCKEWDLAHDERPETPSAGVRSD